MCPHLHFRDGPDLSPRGREVVVDSIRVSVVGRGNGGSGRQWEEAGRVAVVGGQREGRKGGERRVAGMVGRKVGSERGRAAAVAGGGRESGGSGGQEWCQKWQWRWEWWQ